METLFWMLFFSAGMSGRDQCTRHKAIAWKWGSSGRKRDRSPSISCWNIKVSFYKLCPVETKVLHTMCGFKASGISEIFNLHMYLLY